jgi:hypothetical protein
MAGRGSPTRRRIELTKAVRRLNCQEPSAIVWIERRMTKKPIKVEIMQEGDERYLLKTYDDGREGRVPIVKIPKKRRTSSRPYWYWELGTGRRKFF